MPRTQYWYRKSLLLKKYPDGSGFYPNCNQAWSILRGSKQLIYYVWIHSLCQVHTDWWGSMITGWQPPNHQWSHLRGEQTAHLLCMNSQSLPSTHWLVGFHDNWMTTSQPSVIPSERGAISSSTMYELNEFTVSAKYTLTGEVPW